MLAVLNTCPQDELSMASERFQEDLLKHSTATACIVNKLQSMGFDMSLDRPFELPAVWSPLAETIFWVKKSTGVPL